MYTGFSAEILRPQGTPPTHVGKLIRLPFTSLTDRRKRALEFSRPSLALFRKALCHGKLPVDPVAQSGSGVSTVAGTAKIVEAVETPVLSIRPFGNVVSP